VFARINRRNVEQGALFDREFSEDMIAVAQSHRTTYRQDRGTRPTRVWTAADMTVTPDEAFVTGILGYTEPHYRRTLDVESFSWLKGEEEDAEEANEQTLSAFAIDLSDHGRWVALSTSPSMRPNTVREGLEEVLKNAVNELGDVPGEWEVDLVTSRTQITEWLERHPRVFNLKRTIRIPNPGKDLSEEIAAMKAMAARNKMETYSAPYGDWLDTNSEAFQEKLDGTELGNVDMVMKARVAGGGEATFQSKNQVDHVDVVDTGTNFEAAVEVVLAALHDYLGRKADAAQAELDLDDDADGEVEEGDA
jgi:hypothetical protein